MALALVTFYPALAQDVEEQVTQPVQPQEQQVVVPHMAYAISQMEVNGSPAVGPVIIGVSEIENITVLQDLVRQPEIKDRRYQIVHHDSPDRRGVDVGLLYNPRFFKVLNVTNQRINKYLPDYPEFRSRDQLCVTGMLGGCRPHGP